MPEKSDSEIVDEAILHFTLGDESRAERILDDYLCRNSSDLAAWRALAEVLLSVNKFDSAENACRNALALNEDDLASTVTLARILVSRGDREGAEKASARARLLGWKDELAQDEDTN